MRGARRRSRAISEPSLSRRGWTKPSGSRATGDGGRASRNLAAGSKRVGGTDTWPRRSGNPASRRGPLAARGAPHGRGEPGTGRIGSEPPQRCVLWEGPRRSRSWEGCTPGKQGAVARAPAGVSWQGTPRTSPPPRGRATGHNQGLNRHSASLGERVPLAPSGSGRGSRRTGSPALAAGARVGGALRRRDHLLLVVILAVELLVPVEAGGLQGLFAGGALHALLMPEAVVEPQQKPVRDDPLTALADRLGAHRSAYSSNRRSPVNRAGPAPRPTLAGTRSDHSMPAYFPCAPHPGKPPANQPNRVLENEKNQTRCCF